MFTYLLKHFFKLTGQNIMSNNTFTIAGLSTLNGVVKVRFANDLAERIKVLNKNEHTDVTLIDLGTELSKLNCVKALLAHNDFKDEEAQTVLTAYVQKNTVTAGVQKVKKATVPKAAKAKEHVTPAHKTKAGAVKVEADAKLLSKKVDEFSVY
jgi:CheY-like chemotaxis protein